MPDSQSNPERIKRGGTEEPSWPERGPSCSPAGKFLLAYKSITLCSWPILLCYYLLRGISDDKYRQSYPFRMGLKLPQKLAPSAERIWFHALSVGEVLSARPLVKAVREKLSSSEIVITTATEAGQKMARECLSPHVRHFFYLPHDFPWIIDEFARRIGAGCFVQIETDIWVNLLNALSRLSTPRLLVNGRLSPKSARRYRRYRFFFSPFGLFDRIFAQSQQDRASFLALGAEPLRVHAVGNLKFDSLPACLSEPEVRHLKKKVGIDAGRPVWIAGSTHEGEEAILFGVHRHLRRKYPDLLLILAPRRIERAAQIAALAKRRELPVALISAGQTCAGAAVYLLDSLGQLSRFYALADVAFIGGSLVAFGGHNPLEAIAQGKPSVWGPHLFNFREIEANLLRTGIARMAGSEEELTSILDSWLEGPSQMEGPKALAEDLLAASSGCTDRIADSVLEALSPGGKHHSERRASRS